MSARKRCRPPNAGRGRRKGVPNKFSSTVRELITQFAQGCIPEARVLWDRVAMKDPAQALRLLFQLLEFASPKLQKSEVQADITTSNTAPAPSLNDFYSTIECVQIRTVEVDHPFIGGDTKNEH